MSFWNTIVELIKKILTRSTMVTPPILQNKDYVDFGYEAGGLAKKYETSNKGPGYISDGSKWGDPGGDSYGSYQIETNKGTMQDYLTFMNDKFTAALKPYKINSTEFKTMWVKLAEIDSNGFEQSQFNFLAHKLNGHYAAMDYAKTLGWNINNLAMQSAIFSTVNQSGGWKGGIFNRSNILATDSLAVQINKLYDARAAYFRSIKLSDKLRNNIIQSRTVLERKDALKLIN